MVRNTITAIILAGISFSLTAQSYELGAGLGISNYFGDLNPNFSVQRLGPAGGVLGRINVNPRVAFKVAANYANVGFKDEFSNNPFQKARNLRFQSHIFEGIGQVEFNFMPFVSSDYEKFFSPYLFVGGGVFHFNPRTRFDDEWVALQPLGTEGQGRNEEYSLTNPVLAYGGGFKIALNYAWSVNFELSSRRLFTDYLDDVSTLYADAEELEELRGTLAVQLADRSWEVQEAPIGEFGRQRGDPLTNDAYVILGVSIVYHIGGIKCPDF